MPLAAGSRLGIYEILAPLGAGGMGEVYRARDPKLDREVAIKVLPADMAEDAAALARFEREARAVASLSHPNILAIHDFGAADGVHYAVTELLVGESLRQRLDHGSLPPRRAAEIARGIALGLAAAHEKGFVHRDLKPDNIFLSRDGTVKILDFGLARQLPRSGKPADRTLTDHTEPGTLLGTAGYMSPEQVRGETADHRSDIFSFGAVLYEMLSGKRAFKGDTSVETMNAILREEPPPLSESSRPIPPVFERIVTHCMEKHPGDRFQSARDLAFDLGNLSTESSAPGRTQALAPRRRWSRRLALLAAAAAIAAAGVWAGARLGNERPRTESPTFRRLTFRQGHVWQARFAPGGREVVYSAEWEGAKKELFSVRTDTVESHPLGIAGSLLSVSSRSDLVILTPSDATSEFSAGLMSRVPLGGVDPRPLLDKVLAAGWGPGESLAAAVEGDKGVRLEYPLGHVLRASAQLIEEARVSPDGRWVATLGIESPDEGWWIRVTNAKESRRLAASGQFGLAWSPTSRELYFIGGPSRQNMALRAVDLSGRQRVVMPIIGLSVSLQDVGPNGQMLIQQGSFRVNIVCRARGEDKEHDVGWLGSSIARDITEDGKAVLFSENGDGGERAEAYLRPCDGSPAIRLGEGVPLELSNDGKWASVIRRGPNPEVVLLPTGPGSPRKIPVSKIKASEAMFGGAGNGVIAMEEKSPGVVAMEMIPEDGPSRVAEVPDFFLDRGYAVSPDGSTVAYTRKDRTLMTLSGVDGRSTPLPGAPLLSNESLLQWSDDGRYLYTETHEHLQVRVFRREIATARTEPWLVLRPPELPGVLGIGEMAISRDGRSYAFSYGRIESSALFLVEGLK